MKSKKHSILIGHLASFGAYTIFGLNIIFSKDIANSGAVPPLELFTFRAVSAAVLFWVLSCFTERERVPKGDLLRMVGAAVLGLVVPQLTFLYAITMTAPIDLSVVQTITPILTMFVAAIFLKEPITWKKAGGVGLSFGGIVWLILQSTHAESGTLTTPLGIILTVTNSLSFAFYLGLCRPIISRYSVVTLMKWMFTFATLVSLPFSIKGIVALNYGAVTGQVWWEIGYLIFFATFVAYFLIPIGQQRIRPTLVSLYGYLQPLIATVVSIAIGMDKITVFKILAALCVFGGVAIVNQSRAAADRKR